ncbi:MAG: prolyl aminopeptidase [Robiginitomaculum sp.]|nr:MAG: prolyl aminopeptidase [Robiginitomaculum sp.]
MNNQTHQRRGLYPDITPFDCGTIPAGRIHQLYYEQCGHKTAQPIVFLHGGPGGGCSPDMRRFFDPKRWRAVLFDQRGCGRSTPFSELRENTVDHLVEDIERLREHLGIERWVVFGGSWGSTLALAYAEAYPKRVSGLILRGIFLCRKSDIDWLYQDGASALFPDAWEGFLAPIPVAERDDMVAAYHKRLFGDDEKARLIAARAWSRWEGDTVTIKGPEGRADDFEDDRFVDAFARIENAYFANGGCFKTDNQLLDHAHIIADIPCTIVQGRYDAVCPPRGAWALHKALPQSKLEIIGDAGHSSMEPGIIDALVRATDDFAGTK